MWDNNKLAKFGLYLLNFYCQRHSNQIGLICHFNYLLFLAKGTPIPLPEVILLGLLPQILLGHASRARSQPDKQELCVANLPTMLLPGHKHFALRSVQKSGAQGGIPILQQGVHVFHAQGQQLANALGVGVQNPRLVALLWCFEWLFDHDGVLRQADLQNGAVFGVHLAPIGFTRWCSWKKLQQNWLVYVLKKS